MEALHVGPVVTINPETFFPCTKNNMRRLLFIAGPDREKARVDIRRCLEELERIHPENAKRYRDNIRTLDLIV